MSIVRRSVSLFLAVTCSALTLPLPEARACDLCSICEAIGTHKPDAGDVRLGVSEQFSYYGRTQESGHYVPNVGSQHMASSITQFTAGYGVTDRFSLHMHLPYVNRRYRRMESGVVDRGTEAGLGDISLVASYAPIVWQRDDMNLIVQVFGGVKMPTGDSDRLGEHESEHVDSDHDAAEMDPEHEAEDEHQHEHAIRHGDEDHDAAVASAIHAHDLALGSGSWDVPVGASVFFEKGRFLFSGDIQYVFRTEGDFDYEYADDLMWNVGPGYFLSLGDEATISLHLNFSGEYKRKDEMGGVSEDDTRLRALFLGPKLVFTSGNLAGDFGVDLPLDIENSGFQAVSEYQIRLGLTYHL